MNPPQSETSLTLPPQLEGQFSDLRKALLKRTLIEWALISVTCFLTALLLFTAWDRLIPVSKEGRVIMLLLGLSGLFVIGPLRFYFRIGRYHNRQDLTELIRRHQPRFGDRLLGVLELRHQNSDTAHFSPALRQAALDKIAEEAKSINFRDSIPRGARKPLTLIAVPLLLLLGVLALLLPKQLSNATARYILPIAEISRYTVVRFTELPAQMYIARGERTEFIANLKDASLMAEIPNVIVKISGMRTQELPHSEGYLIPIPALERQTKLTLQAGDAYASIKLIPSARPRVEELTLIQTLPSYLKLPPQERRVESSYIEVLEGSTSSLSVTASTKLREANVTPKTQVSVNQNEALLQNIQHQAKQKIQIELTDQNGLTSSSLTQLTLQPKPDKAPSISLNASKRELILLPHETIDLHLTGKDDFGVKELGLLWHPVEVEHLQASTKALNGGPSSRALKTDFAFNPELLKIYPNTYHLYATAIDYLPERELTKSSPLVIHLLSLESHAEHLRQQFSLFLDELDETYEKELTLHFQNQRLAERDKSTLRTKDSDELLQASINGEKQQLKKLGKHHLTAQELLQDSFRNKQLPRSTIKSFALLSEQLNSLLKNDFPEVRNTLESAYDNRFSQEYTQRQLSQAVILQRNAIDRFKQLIEKARAANKRFESSTFMHRLSELARKQQKYSETLWTSYSDVIGVTPTALDPSLREVNTSYSTIQGKHRQSLRWIEEDLRNYALRADQTHFKTLAEDIISSGIYNDMMGVETSLQENHRNLATVTALKCAQTLNLWIQQLSKGLNSPSLSVGQGNNTGNPSTEKEQDTEFMLQVMELIRTQQDLRGRTRAIEQSKRLSSDE